MLPSSGVMDVFRQYVKLYQIRNSHAGELDTGLEQEWKEISFTLDSIFSGLYRPSLDDLQARRNRSPEFRTLLPVDYLRVPTDTDVLCETPRTFFSGKLQDISTRGAYIHARAPFEVHTRLRLTFCTFREEMPLELEGTVAWNNPGRMRKRSYLEGAGIQFVDCDLERRRKLEDFVMELVEETLVRANLI